MLHDLSPHGWPQRRVRAEALALFALYAAAAWAAIVIARQPGTIATVWFANGIAMGFVATAPRSHQGVLLAAAAAGNLVANLAAGDPLIVALAFLPPNMLEVALGTTLMRRSPRLESFSAEPGAFLRVLGLAAGVAPLLGASAGALAMQLLGFAPFERVWVDWYIGTALGATATLPLVMGLRRLDLREVRARLARPASLAGATATPLVTLGALWAMPYPFVAIGVLLIALAFLLPRVNTFLHALLVVATLAFALGVGGFTPPAGGAGLHALVYAAALLVVLPAQVVAVLVARQRAMEEMLAAIGSRTDALTVYSDALGRWRWTNRASALLFGRPDRRLVGNTWSENLPPALLADPFGPLLAQQARDGSAHRLAAIDFGATGVRLMDLAATSALDEDGRPIGVVTSATDVTELMASRRDLERAVDELRAANRNLDHFMRVASHDLREPLNTIVQFCGLIEEDLAADPAADVGPSFAQVRAGASRMKTLLDDVLRYLRLDTPPPGERQPVDLDAIAAEALSALQAVVDRSGARVQVGALGRVPGWPDLLALALRNLLSNALKFVAPGETPDVSVSAQREAGWLRLSVADRGIGVDAARRDQLGTPFTRLHARRRYEGTGLGLAMCRRIAEQHGGHLEIAATAGGGSTFALLLPCS